MATVPQRKLRGPASTAETAVARPASSCRASHSRGRALRTTGAAGLLALAALAGGCVAVGDDHKNPESPAPPPPQQPWQIAGTWQNHLCYAADPTRGGAAGACLAGRVYLFGQQVGAPLVGDGDFAVAVFDDTRPPEDKSLMAWHFDAETFKRLCREDIIGWGYTVFLPWPDVPADLTKIRIRCCYLPAKPPPGSSTRSPLYCESHVTLAPENGVVTSSQSQQPVGPLVPPPTLPQEQPKGK